MWSNFLWPLAAAQHATDLIHRQVLASQCRLLRDYVNQLNAYSHLPHDIELLPLRIQGRDAELLSVRGSSSQRYLLYLHGGGFALGSLETHRELCAALTRHADTRTLAIDYRLAPDHPAPAGLSDARAAYQWLLEQGVTPDRIALAGDSAGGGLVLALLQRLLSEHLSLPAAAVLFSPWVDLSCASPSMDLNAATDPLLNKMQMHAFAQLYAGRLALDNPLISPLYGNMQGLPPLHVQVSLQEVLRDDARRLARAVQQADGRIDLKELAWMPHVWPLLYRYLPQAVASVRQAARFIKIEARG